MAISYAAAQNAPLLGWEDERRLIDGWQRRKDSAALETLLFSHARLVHYWARKVGRDPVEREDLVSEGIFGLIRAADLFDPSHKTRFSTYARWWVKNAILTALERLRLGVIPTSRTEETLTARSGPSGDPLPLLENLPSEEPTPEERIITMSAQTAMQEQLNDALDTLEALDREVLIRRNLQHPPEPFATLASRLGVDTARLRQLEKRAMTRLRYALVSRGVLTSRTQEG